jgi:hypothetical protein
MVVIRISAWSMTTPLKFEYCRFFRWIRGHMRNGPRPWIRALRYVGLIDEKKTQGRKSLDTFFPLGDRRGLMMVSMVLGWIASPRYSRKMLYFTIVFIFKINMCMLCTTQIRRVWPGSKEFWRISFSLGGVYFALGGINFLQSMSTL